MADWASLRNYYAIQNVIAMRPRLPFWVIRSRGGAALDWMELSDPQPGVMPFHFEIFFGKEDARDRYYTESLEIAAKEGPICRELFGFADLFYPMGDSHFLYTGQFLSEPLTWEGACERWRKLTGQEPASQNPDFSRFVRMALTRPVLDPELLDATRSFMAEMSRFLAGERGTDIAERIDALNRDVLDVRWPIEDWVASAVSADKLQPAPWYFEGELTDWLAEGMGIRRLPTTAFVLMPLDPPGEVVDPVEALVRNVAVQRACIVWARELPNTAATRLADYAISFITSPRPGVGDAAARVELREQAEQAAEMVYERFGLRSAVGIGKTMPTGSRLTESHRDAVLALHMAIQLDRDILFHDEHEGTAATSYVEVQRAKVDLLAAFDKESATEIKLASDRFVGVVLTYADERLEVVRSHFLATLFDVLASIERRHPLRRDARDSFAAELAAEVELAPSLYKAIDGFKQALPRLSFVASKSLAGPKSLRLQATLEYIQKSFEEPLRLPEVAKKAGFSVPAFSRAFKEATGTSFLAYVRSVRVDHAKKLLTTTPMTTEQVAQACGFQSSHHLIRSFKRVTGKTPGAWRSEHRGAKR